MTLHHIGRSGSGGGTRAPWNVDDLGAPLMAAAQALGHLEATPLQQQAASQGVFMSRRNLLVSAPTNTGKTLIGYLVLMEALARGGRAVLVEPLRALAREKADELHQAAPSVAKALGASFTVRISTGDYRLETETFSDPPPGAELIVTTPERFEAILRVPENRPWWEQLGAVCIDEAHLVSDPRRGPTLEALITHLLCMSAPPRLALLSATLGVTDQVMEWLDPCDIVSSTERTPPLEKWLLELEDAEDATVAAGEWLREQLVEPEAQALVFIYQARQTASVAAALNQYLGPLAGRAGAQPYNSQMAPAQREEARARFVEGASRVVVATSSLAMGVNLPATHVVVRDLSYPGARSPGIPELLQMMGRAGRGDRPGSAVVVKRASDMWTTVELVEALREESVPPMTSSLMVGQTRGHGGAPGPATQAVASILMRAGPAGCSLDDLETFFARSLAGRGVQAQVAQAARWLEAAALAHMGPDDEQCHLTALGEATVRAVLPLNVGAGFGCLVRDLLSIREGGEALERWTPLDFLVCMELAHEDSLSLRRFSAELVTQVNDWCEGHPQKTPVLFREWLMGEKGHSQADEVLGSLGVAGPGKHRDVAEWARQRGYIATFNAIVLWERSLGRGPVDLERQFGIERLEGIEERWRDTALWLLSGVTHLLDVRVFYHHLKDQCEASPERVKEVKGLLRGMNRQALELIEQLKLASPLGGLVAAMRRLGRAGVGVESVRKLEAAGYSRVVDVSRLSVEQVVGCGVRRDIAKRITSYLRRTQV